MNVGVLCEYSGVVRDAFLRAGHNAVSCDVLDSESDKGLHLRGSLFDFDWSWCDLLIIHPPCTYIALSGNRWYAGSEKRKQAALFIDNC